MKQILLLFLFSICISCSKKTQTTKEQVTAYYKGFQNSNFSQVKQTLADSLTTVEGDYTTVFSPEEYHKQFKWDSVFQPKYQIISIEEKGKYTVATIQVKSRKFEFLKNNPLTIVYQFSFKSGKINKIVTVDFIDFKYDLWEKQKMSLVNWIKINNPELDGFINDLTMKGAQNYLKAIDLYTNRVID